MELPSTRETVELYSGDLERRLMIAPVTLREGLRLFGDSGSERKWHLNNVVGYEWLCRLFVQAPIVSSRSAPYPRSRI